jgi:hypothetical protein
VTFTFLHLGENIPSTTITTATITITTRITAAGTGTEGTTVAILVPYHYALVRRKSISS